MQVVAEMVVLNCMRLWLCFYSEISMVVVECKFEGQLWNQIWNRVKNYLDKPRPQLLQRIKEVNLELKDELDFYCLAETNALGEFPSICGTYGHIPRPDGALPLRPHFHPESMPNLSLNNIQGAVDIKVLMNDIKDLCCKGIDFLRNEATDIVAFVVADSQCLHRPGIPPHIPIAYAMRGPSFTTDTSAKC